MVSRAFGSQLPLMLVVRLGSDAFARNFLRAGMADVVEYGFV
jgi:hypothetical protein